MSIHTTPLPHADQPGLEAAEPTQRASRFDERGIALQTIIIMVVLLAIAGTVAAVLVTRAGEETSRLEADDDRRWTEIDNLRGCELAGGRPDSNSATDAIDAVTDANPMAICRPPAP